MEVNLEALRRREPQSSAIGRYAEIARLATGESSATADDAVRWAAALCRRLEVPGLRAYGVAESDVDALAADAARASSMKGNPIPLTGEELKEIVRRSL
jgi:alcohol dehydrogenase class IV